ncbi:energy transducer TonB [bacterium]|nr:energy transducer TonB [bacterium]
MNRSALSSLDTGTRWCYRMVGLSILITFGIFMLLPIAEMIHKQGKRYQLREIETREILKPLPPVLPKVKRKKARPKPKLFENQRKLNPMMIQAALQVDPGFGDFSLQFGLRDQLTRESLVFELSEVDESPEPIRKIKPLYPAQARLKKINGCVMVSIIVTTDGSVEAVKVTSAEPAGVFEASAIKAVSKWRFTPGKRNGKKVRTRVLVPIDFEI